MLFPCTQHFGSRGKPGWWLGAEGISWRDWEDQVPHMPSSSIGEKIWQAGWLLSVGHWMDSVANSCPVVTKAGYRTNFGALGSCSRSGVVSDASIDLNFWRRRGYATHRPDDVVLRSSVILRAISSWTSFKVKYARRLFKSFISRWVLSGELGGPNSTCLTSASGHRSCSTCLGL